MIPAILASVGLPLLVKAVEGALSGLDHPAAKAASGALKQVGAAIGAKEIPPEQVAEAHRHLERMTELDSAEARAAIEQINGTMRVEAASEDWYVRRWRPTFGYSVAATWVATMGAVSWAIVAEPTQAPTIIAALVNTSPIWGIALGVLGISVVKRSQDKARLAG
ncbi:MAG TPA: 3TM-type holin [Candidatus Omnitrophota bacterium]|nr:3TM-type holin [Candidatus Omnitrophota bacterium]